MVRVKINVETDMAGSAQEVVAHSIKLAQERPHGSTYMELNKSTLFQWDAAVHWEDDIKIVIHERMHQRNIEAEKVNKELSRALRNTDDKGIHTPEKAMSLFVFGWYTVFEVDDIFYSDAVATLRQKIGGIRNISPHCFRMFHHGENHFQELSDNEKKLMHYDIFSNDQITVYNTMPSCHEDTSGKHMSPAAKKQKVEVSPAASPIDEDSHDSQSSLSGSSTLCFGGAPWASDTAILDDIATPDSVDSEDDTATPDSVDSES